MQTRPSSTDELTLRVRRAALRRFGTAHGEWDRSRTTETKPAAKDDPHGRFTGWDLPDYESIEPVTTTRFKRQVWTVVPG
jgi:inorganic triphosphatase YgiF